MPEKALLPKVVVGSISEKLVSSPEARKQFLADRNAFLMASGLDQTTAQKSLVGSFFDKLEILFGDGFCCGGCGCS